MRYWKNKALDPGLVLGVGVACYLDAPDSRRCASLLCLAESFRAQSWPGWRMAVFHDGPLPPGDFSAVLSRLRADGRVSFVETPTRQGRFGHPHRQAAIDLLSASADWLVLTNDDNYYAPSFAEWVLAEGESASKAGKKLYDMVYCDMVHSHRKWKPMSTQPRYRHVDLGAVAVRSALAAAVRFDKFEFNGDGDWIDRLARRAAGRIAKIPATLFVHN